jgi:Sec-independent protein translocase protein TatA
MTLGIIEVLLVVLVFVILGPRRIADLFRSMGRGVQDFVDGLGKDKEQKELPKKRDTGRKTED